MNPQSIGNASHRDGNFSNRSIAKNVQVNVSNLKDLKIGTTPEELFHNITFGGAFKAAETQKNLG